MQPDSLAARVLAIEEKLDAVWDELTAKLPKELHAILERVGQRDAESADLAGKWDSFAATQLPRLIELLSEVVTSYERITGRISDVEKTLAEVVAKDAQIGRPEPQNVDLEASISKMSKEVLAGRR